MLRWIRHLPLIIAIIIGITLVGSLIFRLANTNINITICAGHPFILLFPLVFLALFLPVGVPAQPDLLLLISIQIFILIQRMLPQISHIDIDFGLI